LIYRSSQQTQVHAVRILSLHSLHNRLISVICFSIQLQLQCTRLFPFSETTMWKLKFAEGGSPWLRSFNNHVGRQVWEFDPKLGSPQDLLEIEKARQNFHENRFTTKHSSDLLMRLQVSLLPRSILSHITSLPITRCFPSNKQTNQWILYHIIFYSFTSCQTCFVSRIKKFHHLRTIQSSFFHIKQRSLQERTQSTKSYPKSKLKIFRI